MIVIDITAYNINDQIYFRRGKPNGKKKKKLQAQIQNGEIIPQWEDIKQNSYSEKRRILTKASNSNSAIHETNKQNIGDLIQWLRQI